MCQMMKRCIEIMKKRLSIAIVFIIIGSLIYLLFRNNIIIKNNVISLIIRNYIPDACWTISLYFTSINFTSKLTKKSLLINFIYVLTIALTYEILQYLKIVKGTFDRFDILVYLFSITISSIIERKLRREK